MDKNYSTGDKIMTFLYLYLLSLIIIFIFLGYKFVTKKRREKQNYEEREDQVFYDAVKKVRRD